MPHNSCSWQLCCRRPVCNCLNIEEAYIADLVITTIYKVPVTQHTNKGLWFYLLAYYRLHHHVVYCPKHDCREQNAASPLKFTYTAMHGVGTKFVEEAFKTFGFSPFIPVPQQVEPDPEFPTVKFPNPEEGKSALVYITMALHLLTAQQSIQGGIVSESVNRDSQC